MEQQSIQTPSNPFYLDELINTVNNNPSPKNILKMQQVMNQFKFDMSSTSPPLKEDGILGKKTMGEVKDFRVMQQTNKEEEAFQSREDFDKKIEMQIEQVAEERMEKFGRAKDRTSVFDMIKGDEEFDLKRYIEDTNMHGDEEFRKKYPQTYDKYGRRKYWVDKRWVSERQLIIERMDKDK